jgi:hypothetical protein
MKFWENCTVTDRWNVCETHTAKVHKLQNGLQRKVHSTNFSLNGTDFFLSQLLDKQDLYGTSTHAPSDEGQVIRFPGPWPSYSRTLPRFILFGAITVLTQIKDHFFPLIHHLKNGWVCVCVLSYSCAHTFLESLQRMAILNSAIQQCNQWLCLQGMLHDSSVSAIQYSQFVVGQPIRIMLEVQILTLHNS